MRVLVTMEEVFVLTMITTTLLVIQMAKRMLFTILKRRFSDTPGIDVNWKFPDAERSRFERIDDFLKLKGQGPHIFTASQRISEFLKSNRKCPERFVVAKSFQQAHEASKLLMSTNTEDCLERQFSVICNAIIGPELRAAGQTFYAIEVTKTKLLYNAMVKESHPCHIESLRGNMMMLIAALQDHKHDEMVGLMVENKILADIIVNKYIPSIHSFTWAMPRAIRTECDGLTEFLRSEDEGPIEIVVGNGIDNARHLASEYNATDKVSVFYSGYSAKIVATDKRGEHASIRVNKTRLMFEYYMDE